MEGKDPIADFEVLRNELNKYSPALLDKPSLIALNKIDTLQDKEQRAVARQFKKKGFSVRLISAFVGTGVKELVSELGEVYERLKVEV